MSLCVCVSVEHLLLKKACFLLWKGEEQREDGRGARRRADDKSRTAQRACRNQMQTNQPHRFLSRVYLWRVCIHIVIYCVKHTCLRGGGHEYWIVFTTTGSFHLTQKDVSVFWLFDLLNRNVPRATQRSTLMFTLAGAIQSILLWNHCEFEHNRDLCLQFYTDFTDLDQFTRLVTSTAYSGPLRVSTHWVIFKHHSVHILETTDQLKHERRESTQHIEEGRKQSH